jgi:hypothetical protein
MKMTKKEKDKAKAQKTGRKPIKYAVTSGGKRRVGKRKRSY